MQLRLYDSEAARMCLAGKYVVSLGDSTMTETVYDLIMLMAGLAANLTELNAFVHNATRCAVDLISESPNTRSL